MQTFQCRLGLCPGAQGQHACRSPEKVSFFTRNVFSFCGRGPAADALRRHLRVRRSLLAARPDRGFCGEEPHGAGARSFRNCHQSGVGSDSSETRYLEPKPSFYLFSCWSVRDNALVTGCAFLLGKFIWCSELWIPPRDLLFSKDVTVLAPVVYGIS